MTAIATQVTEIVRHFELTAGGYDKTGHWMFVDARDTRENAKGYKDRLRHYAARQQDDDHYLLANADNGNRYQVTILQNGGMTCNCPAGQRPPRRSTTTTVDPTHGSCVHRDIITALPTLDRRLQGKQAQADATPTPNDDDPLRCSHCGLPDSSGGPLCSDCLNMCETLIGTLLRSARA